MGDVAIGLEQALAALPMMIDLETDDGGEIVVQLARYARSVSVEVVAPAEDGEPADSASVTLTLDQARSLHLQLTALLLKAETL
jgi:hypothetical protein